MNLYNFTLPNTFNLDEASFFTVLDALKVIALKKQPLQALKWEKIIITMLAFVRASLVMFHVSYFN